ncbi:MAG: H-NS histone family protein [Aquabacterium sp.]|nr:H-NS histone family protein [Aquabacterium sp.]
MAKTYTQIQTQIRKLQQEADTLKAKEVADVVARIQLAIAHYGLTTQDLFGGASAAAKPKAAGKRAEVSKPATATKRPSQAKYQDDAGHQWSGIGKRPNWFKAALASGKSAADLLVHNTTAN